MWSGQKVEAVEAVNAAIADGQPKTVSELASLVRSMGVSAKNSYKAVYAVVASGSATLNGDWSTGTIQKVSA